MICVGLELDKWEYVKEGLQAALDIDHNKYTLDHIKDALDAQIMQLWCIHDVSINCVFVTEIVNYPNKRVLQCIALYGENPQHWIGILLQSMHEYAIQNKCDVMETGGRKGWEKMFKQQGWNSHIKVSRSVNYAK